MPDNVDWYWKVEPSDNYPVLSELAKGPVDYLVMSRFPLNDDETWRLLAKATRLVLNILKMLRCCVSAHDTTVEYEITFTWLHQSLTPLETLDD